MTTFPRTYWKPVAVGLSIGVLILVGVHGVQWLTRNLASGEDCSLASPRLIAPGQPTPHVRIWGDWVAWDALVEPANHPAGFESDLYLYHIRTGKVRLAASGPNMQGVPELYGSILVWREWTVEGPIILRAADLETGRNWTLDIPGQWGELAPRGIYGDVVLVDARTTIENQTGLYAFNLTSGAWTQITDYVAGWVSIWERSVVWSVPSDQRAKGEPSRIVRMDLDAKAVTTLVESPFGVDEPRLFGNRLVYMKGSGSGVASDWDIYGLDLETGIERPIAVNDTGPNSQEAPRFSGGWVVYIQDPPGGPPGISSMAYHWETGQRFEAVRAGSQVRGIDVWGDRMAATRHNPSGGWDVVLVCLPKL